MPQVPWQLYLFSAFQLVGFFMSSTVLFWFHDPCKAPYGKKCNDSETVLSNLNSAWLLSLAVYYFLLTYLNREKPERLKRLAYFAIYSTVANLAAVMMIGAANVAGIMRTSHHVIYLVVLFILFFILAMDVWSDTAMVAHEPFREGLGFNLKGLIVLYAVVSLAWIFANSDFQPIGSVFPEGTTMSPLASSCWNYWSVMVLQVLFVWIFSLAYESDADREALVIASIVLLAYGMYMAWALRSLMISEIVSAMYIHNAILIVLALGAIARYRMNMRRGDYEAVAN